MKLGVFVAASIGAERADWLKKEWQVQDAYFAADKIVLSDPSVRNVLYYKLYLLLI